MQLLGIRRTSAKRSVQSVRNVHDLHAASDERVRNQSVLEKEEKKETSRPLPLAPAISDGSLRNVASRLYTLPRPQSQRSQPTYHAHPVPRRRQRRPCRTHTHTHPSSTTTAGTTSRADTHPRQNRTRNSHFPLARRESCSLL